MPVERVGLSRRGALCPLMRKELADTILLSRSCQLVSFQLSPGRGKLLFPRKSLETLSHVFSDFWDSVRRKHRGLWVFCHVES